MEGKVLSFEDFRNRKSAREEEYPEFIAPPQFVGENTSAVHIKERQILFDLLSPEGRGKMITLLKTLANQSNVISSDGLREAAQWVATLSGDEVVGYFNNPNNQEWLQSHPARVKALAGRVLGKNVFE